MIIYSVKFWKYYYNIYIINNYVIKGGFSEKPEGQLVHNSVNNYIVNYVLKYFSGIPVDFSTIKVIYQHGTYFQKKVWDTIRSIPYGKLVSYRWVAQKIGKPTAVRAVGNAIAKNPIPIIIPCHRVIRSDGTLGGFTSIGGLILKKKLLKLEGIRV